MFPTIFCIDIGINIEIDFDIGIDITIYLDRNIVNINNDASTVSSAHACF